MIISARSPAVVAALLALGIASAPAGEPDAKAVFAATHARRGLIVHVGAQDGALAIALAQAEAVVVLAVAADATTEAVLRERLVAAGVHGQATATSPSVGRLPLVDDTAAAVVADLDAALGVSRDELLRVLRPQGKAWLKQGGSWQVIEKPRPADIDDWGQYHHDAAMSDCSADRRAGPAYGLQWASGPQAVHSHGVRVSGAVCLMLDGAPDGVRAEALIARDAWSGLPLWRRDDLMPRSRYALIVDRERVYVQPSAVQGVPAPCMIALDAATGATVLEYREGLTFSAPADLPKDRKAADPVLKALDERGKDLSARLGDDGSLLQVAARDLVVLDARTGKRRWAKTAGEGQVWMHPVLAADAVHVVEGRPSQSYSYTHWPVATVMRIRCFALTDGAERWAYAWPADREPATAYNMVIGAGRLGLALRQPAEGKGQLRGLVVDAVTGKEAWFGENAVFKGEIGGGHSSARVIPVGDRLWLSTIIALPGSIALARPEDAASLDRRYGKLLRPVGCTAYRASPNWIFGSLTVYGLDDQRVFHTDVARTSCDVGAFPANGLTYLTPNHCFCQPYLPGSMAFHPRRITGEDAGERRERGPATPAAAKPGAGWPMYLHGNRRGAWTEATLPATLAPAWAIKPAGAAPTEMLARSWAGHWYAQGPVSQASAAEGVVVVAIAHRQQVVALDPATGAERWRTTVDGRVDTAPTIHAGLVLAGTRNGWLYALNRDSGALVWRFLCAPRRSRIAVDGQLESPWPLFGTVNVDERGIHAVAGRHTDSDGGLWWWRLEAATGTVLGHGRFGSDDLKSTTYGGGNPGKSLPTGMNTPAVMDAEHFLLAGLHARRVGDGLVAWNALHDITGQWEPNFWAKRHQTGVLVPGNQGMINRVGFLGGYKLNAFSYTQGRLYAWKGDDFVMVGGSSTLQHRGGEGDSRLRRMRRLPELKEIAVPDGKDPTVMRKKLLGAEVVWEKSEDLPRGDGISAIAVAGDTLLVGLEVTNRDRWRERQAMAFRLQTLALADGSVRQELALPAKPILAGIACADGRVLVVTADGTVSCFAGK